jgi:hypothetical protein
MKKLIFTIGFLISVNSSAQVQKTAADPQVLSAVQTIYEMGRHQADAGGISSLLQFEVGEGVSVVSEGASTFQIVMAVMNHLRHEPQFDVVTTACQGQNLATAEGLQNCVRQIIERQPAVQANYQPLSITSFLNEIAEWYMESDEMETWFGALDTVKSHIEMQMADKNYQEFVLGYDHVADVFMSIMISADRRRVLVLTGDYGA